MVVVVVLDCRRAIPRLLTSTGLAAMVVVPKTFAGLKRLSTANADVWSGIRVDAFVGAYCRRVFESLSAMAALFVELARVLEERVLLQVVTLLESDAADIADERSFLRMRPNVVLVVRVLSKRLPTHVARPLRRGPTRQPTSTTTADCSSSAVRLHSRLHNRHVLAMIPIRQPCLVQRQMHSQVLLARECLRAMEALVDESL